MGKFVCIYCLKICNSCFFEILVIQWTKGSDCMSSCVISALYSDFPSVASNHWHDCHQLIYIAKGEAIITAGNKEYSVKEGTVAVFNRFEEHSLFSQKEGCERYIIRISPENIDSFLERE